MERYVIEYQCRSWQTYEVPIEEWYRVQVVDAHPEFDACDSGSDQARKIEFSPKRFYRDLEYIAADIDSKCGMELRRLAEDWRGHQKGSLVMAVYSGLKKTPMTLTIAVETNP